jgi:hypothetical protein
MRVTWGCLSSSDRSPCRRILDPRKATSRVVKRTMYPRESNSLSGNANPASQNANVELRNPGKEVVDRSATNCRRMDRLS